MGPFKVLITLVRLQNNPNKLADATLILDGGLMGFQLEGFQVWAQNDSAGFNVTFPARTYEKHGGKTGYYSYLRAVDGGLELGELLKAQIIEAFHLEKSRPPGEQRPQPARSPRAVYGGAARKATKAPPVKLAPPAAAAADPFAPRLVRPPRPAADFSAALAASAALPSASEISRTLARNAEVDAAITPGIVREAEAAGVSVPALIAARMAPAAPDPSAIALAALAAREAEAAAPDAAAEFVNYLESHLAPEDRRPATRAREAAAAAAAAPPPVEPEAAPEPPPVPATVRAAVRKLRAVAKRRRKAAKGKPKAKRRPVRSRARKAAKPRRKAAKRTRGGAR